MRSIGDKGGVRATLKNFSYSGAVDRACVTFKLRRGGGPHLPRRMGDVIFEAAAGALRGITPIMLGDELLHTALRGMRGSALRLREKLAPAAVIAPPILGGLG